MSWNVNGLRAAARKGFLIGCNDVQPDVLGIQETKCHPDQLDSRRAPTGRLLHAYFASAERKGYSGVALYSRIQPLDVQIGLGLPEYDREGRTIVAEFEEFMLIVAYFPNGSRDHSRVPFKMRYKKKFLDYCNDLRRREERSCSAATSTLPTTKSIWLARGKIKTRPDFYARSVIGSMKLLPRAM